MNRLALALLASAAALAATARADTRFSIGIHIGGPTHPHFAPPPVVACPPAPTIVYAPARGYWQEVVVKTWVPERWVSSRDRFGRFVRICEPGYFTYRTDRVWVDGGAVAYRHDPRGNTSPGPDWGRDRPRR